jgi:hypothetical protein
VVAIPTPPLRPLARALRAEAELALELPLTAVAVLRGLRTIAESAGEAREAVGRLNRLTVRLEALLDDPAVSSLPQTLGGLRETQLKVAAIAASTERITSFIDDAGTRLGALPGLLRRPFRVGEPAVPLPPVTPLPPEVG